MTKPNTSSTSPESPTSATTVEDLFYNANWAEREVSEMSGLFFSSKNDTRNLLMPYGEFFHPLKKVSPSIGLFELYYDLVSDLIVKSLVNSSI
jgi:NADH:ubiquinone oxidoreductase subunit C